MRWALLFVACSHGAIGVPDGTDLSPPPDLAAHHDLSALPDLTTLPDLTAHSDLSGFCGNTALAGTCLQSFFAPIVPCFNAMGSCNHAFSNGGQLETYCWTNGAKATTSHGAGDIYSTFTNANSVQCFAWDNSATGSTFTAGGNTITFNPKDGSYTCGGMSGTVGANCGGCAELCALLPPTCTDGVCP